MKLYALTLDLQAEPKNWFKNQCCITRISNQLKNISLFTIKFSTTGLSLSLQKTSQVCLPPPLKQLSEHFSTRMQQCCYSVSWKGSPRSICRCFRESLPLYFFVSFQESLCMRAHQWKVTLLSKIFEQSLVTTPQICSLVTQVNHKIELSLQIQNRIPKTRIFFSFQKAYIFSKCD